MEEEVNIERIKAMIERADEETAQKMIKILEDDDFVEIDAWDSLENYRLLADKSNLSDADAGVALFLEKAVADKESLIQDSNDNIRAVKVPASLAKDISWLAIVGKKDEDDEILVDIEGSPSP